MLKKMVESFKTSFTAKKTHIVFAPFLQMACLDFLLRADAKLKLPVCIYCTGAHFHMTAFLQTC